MKQPPRNQAGFTLIEILIVIVILVLISGFVFSSMIEYGRMQELRAVTADLTAIIKEARGKTISAETLNRFGVYLATTSVVAFEGTTYTGSNLTNATTTFSGYTLTVNFPGTTTKQIIFDRLTGAPSATGTITLTQNTTNSTSSITIMASGLLE